MDFEIVFDKNVHTLSEDGTVAKSDIIYIPPGFTALLSLYNMTTIISLAENGSKKELITKSCLTLKKLSFGKINEKEIDVKCGERVNVNDELIKLLKQRRVYSEPVYQDCCEWVINPANNYILIPVPGFYELETEDLDQLDTAYVEYALLTAEQSIAIPNGFKLGGQHGMCR